MRVQRSARDLSAREYLIALFDIDSRAVRNDIGSILFLAAYANLCLIIFSRFNRDDRTIRLADFRETLWLTRLEQFLDSRKTLGDVAAGYARLRP